MKSKTFAFFGAVSLFATMAMTIQTFAQGPTFAPTVTYGSGGYIAQSVAVADVNGDGKPDLLVANCGFACANPGPGTVGVLLGNGDGTFQAAVTYGSGGSTLSIAVADVNGDGKPDVVVANVCSSGTCPNGTVGVLLGNGDGTFQPVVTYGSGGQAAWHVVVADVNGDGKPDIVVANLNGGVDILLGNGDGTFQTAVTYGTGGLSPDAVAVADVNGDGKPDIVVANECDDTLNCTNGSVGVLLGNGDGTFQSAATYGTGGQVLSVAVADVNGDGKPDIVVADYCAINSSANGCPAASLGLVGVLLGNGDGAFQPVVTYGSGAYIGISVTVADVNGDGKPDIVVANSFADSAYVTNGAAGVLLGNGDGTFRTAVTYALGGFVAQTVAVADVNGDGKPDIVVANHCDSGNCTNGTASVLINTTPSPYKASVQQPINADGSSIFNAKRGVIPVKFTLTQNGTQTCALPPATISVTRTAGGTAGPIDEAGYLSHADNGSNFRIDTTACQYIYNLAASSLGVGVYRVDISITGQVVGSGSFALK